MIIFENVFKKNNKLTQIPVLLKGQMNTIGMPTEDEKEAAFFFINMTQYALCLISFINAHILRNRQCISCPRRHVIDFYYCTSMVQWLQYKCIIIALIFKRIGKKKFVKRKKTWGKLLDGKLLDGK